MQMGNFGSPFTIGDPSQFMPSGGTGRGDAPPAPIRAMVRSALERMFLHAREMNTTVDSPMMTPLMQGTGGYPVANIPQFNPALMNDPSISPFPYSMVTGHPALHAPHRWNTMGGQYGEKTAIPPWK